MRRSSSISWVNPKCNDKYPCKTEAEGDYTEKRRNQRLEWMVPQVKECCQLPEAESPLELPEEG